MKPSAAAAVFQKWLFYDKPPAYCTENVGKVFVMDDDPNTEVRVLSFHLGVDCIPARIADPKTGDIPTVNFADFMIEVLTGPFKGKTFAVGALWFLGYFEPKV